MNKENEKTAPQPVAVFFTAEEADQVVQALEAQANALWKAAKEQPALAPIAQPAAKTTWDLATKIVDAQIRASEEAEDAADREPAAAQEEAK